MVALKGRKDFYYKIIYIYNERTDIYIHILFVWLSEIELNTIFLVPYPMNQFRLAIFLSRRFDFLFNSFL